MIVNCLSLNQTHKNKAIIFMKIIVKQGEIQASTADTLIVNLFDDVTTPGGATGAVDQALGGAISELTTKQYLYVLQPDSATVKKVEANKLLSIVMPLKISPAYSQSWPPMNAAPSAIVTPSHLRNVC